MAHQGAAAHFPPERGVVPLLYNGSNVVSAGLRFTGAWQGQGDKHDCNLMALMLWWRVMMTTMMMPLLLMTMATTTLMVMIIVMMMVMMTTYPHLPVQLHSRCRAPHIEQGHHAPIHVVVQVAVEQPGAWVVRQHVQCLKGTRLDGHLGVGCGGVGWGMGGRQQVVGLRSSKGLQ